MTDGAGNTLTATLAGPNAYALTADASLRAVQRVLAGGIAPGTHTPATALGADFVLTLDGVTVTPPR